MENEYGLAEPFFHFSFVIFHLPLGEGGSLLARIDRDVTMDPVTSPLIHKDSGRQARVDPGEETPSTVRSP